MKGRNNRRNLHYQTPRKMKNEDYINRNSLNLAVNYSLWAIESAEKITGSPSYILRKGLASEYALICAVRHVGPRRREEMAHNIGDLELAYEFHKRNALAMLAYVRNNMSKEVEE